MQRVPEGVLFFVRSLFITGLCLKSKKSVVIKEDSMYHRKNNHEKFIRLYGYPYFVDLSKVRA